MRHYIEQNRKSLCCSLYSFLEHEFAGRNKGDAVQHGDADHRSLLRTFVNILPGE
jgi:hypothetical protein